ncbi:hypothetical protein HN51_028599 [Arachis hypogaea]|uniref:PPM-type phosphatase domain-containing protein n=2 Tax=Arachis TaxID=3817 RepID=A0A445BI25_ARAHY|nr:putative protein phosphatase 2C-like protein 44 [Arachis duranensis]XP_025621605.1 putative protein phosphatase 2C-like protein 44 [Arachis hypogaea]QHO35118.1 Putative protein phosphatase 2C-like protein [Arachis hypogaea]RYR38338.1 hypothetical protein Ahy_A09g043370 [Arachis hypogaea]
MGFKYLPLKLKVFRLKRFLLGRGRRGVKRKHVMVPAKKPSWMMPITHGYYVVEHHQGSEKDLLNFDSVVVQREQMDHNELWYFGIFDVVVGDVVTKYIQSNFFNKKLQESHLRRKSKETLKRAYLGARAKIREEYESDERSRMGSGSCVMVINGEKLVIANMGDYKTVVCRDGIAHHHTSSGRHHQHSPRIHWSRRLFSGKSHSRGSELVVKGERIDSDTEFLIMASNGIWEVMQNQEAVNLISHIEDPQEAAEFLAKEAMNRMSKSNISCLIIRFE